MIYPPARTLAAALAAGVLLTGCSTSDPTAGTGSTGNPSSSALASPSASGSASPTSTLTAEEQQAFTEATEVVLAYRQTITDLYSGARTNLNDLNDVAAGELLDQGLQNIQQSLSDGWRREPQGVELVLVSASPLDFELAGNPNTVVVRACIDATEVTIVDPAGTRSSGIREELDYTVTRTSYLPDPGWVVTRVTTGNDDPKARQC
jgi:hypothetical protein